LTEINLGKREEQTFIIDKNLNLQFETPAKGKKTKKLFKSTKIQNKKTRLFELKYRKIVFLAIKLCFWMEKIKK
jgi:hypothetical protein